MRIKNVYFSVYDSHGGDGRRTYAEPLCFELDDGRFFGGCFVNENLDSLEEQLQPGQPDPHDPAYDEDEGPYWDALKEYQEKHVKPLEDLWSQLDDQLFVSSDNPVVFGHDDGYATVLGVNVSTEGAEGQVGNWDNTPKEKRTLKNDAWCVTVNVPVGEPEEDDKPLGGTYQVVLTFKNAPRAAVEHMVGDVVQNGDFTAELNPTFVVVEETADDKWHY